jgi:hypothetical protein
VFAEMPNVEPLAGLPNAWHWASAPGFDSAAALAADGERAFRLYALDSYDEGLVTAALSFARDHHGELAVLGKPLTLAEGFTHPGFGFDMVAAKGPGLHEYHQEDPLVHAATWAVCPAFRCEFSGTENADEVHYRWLRAAGVTPSRLKREPRPYVKIRYKAPAGRVQEKAGFVTPSFLSYELPALENTDRFIEFENYQNRIWRVEWDGTWILIDEGGEHRALGIDELLEFARATIYGPSLDAGTSAFNKRH